MKKGKQRVYVVQAKRDGGKCKLVWKDPKTGKPRQQMLDTTNRRRAERLARDKELELATTGEAVADASVESPKSVAWSEFCDRYEDEHLADLSDGTFLNWQAARHAFERICNPQHTFEIGSPMLSKFAKSRREAEISPNTIAKDVRHLKAALAWGKQMGYVKQVPQYTTASRGKRQSQMRSRPISDAEFELMLKATELVRKHDAPLWSKLIRGLYLSGLRASEATILSWDSHTDFSVDLDGGSFPRFKIFQEEQKSDNDEYAPMAPDFADFLRETPPKERAGPVFLGGKYRPSWVMRVVGEIGQKAGILVDRKREQFAGPHTLRRTFGTRWAMRVQPAVLQRLMRHAHISTTMGFYVSLDSDRIGEQLYSEKKSLESAEES